MDGTTSANEPGRFAVHRRPSVNLLLSGIPEKFAAVKAELSFRTLPGSVMIECTLKNGAPLTGHPLNGRIMTVCGAVDRSDIGITLAHEHLLFSHTPPLNENLDPDTAIQELSAYARSGGGTLVEVTSRGMRRDAAGLQRVSEAAAVHVIMGCGYYKEAWHPPDMSKKTVESIAQEMVHDITVGADDTGIRAGVIGEIGVSPGAATDNEKKVILASARAQQATGAAINVHFDIGTKEELRSGILDVLQGEGACMDRVITSHYSFRTDELDYHARMARRGTYIEYDMFGQEIMYSKPMSECETESRMIRELIDRGYLNRILFSQDVYSQKMFACRGGWGYAHILDNVLPKLMARGITGEEIRTIMVENPQNVFSFTY